MASCTTYYWCIFKVPLTGPAVGKLGAVIDGILTMSGCGCHNHCNPHTALSKDPHDEETYEGMVGILAKNNDVFSTKMHSACTGHRLINLHNDEWYPSVNITQTADVNTFNALRNIIDDELNTRKASPLYANADKGNIPNLVNKNVLILRSFVQRLNNAIQNSDFYKDTIAVPAQTDLPTITSTVATADSINKLSNAVKKLRADCICYSDCNSYYMCSCYGYCNHY